MIPFAGVLNCKKALLSAVLGVLAVSSSHAVKYGDEAFGDDEYGKFWAFHSTGVSIVNPDTCQVETTVSVDGDGQPLPSRYYDVIYLEKDGKGYVGINSAIPVDDDAHGLSSGAGEAIFFSSSMEDRQQPVVSRVVVGPRPVHSYGVKIGEEVEYWTHSDADGHFYVINLKDLTKHTGNAVEAHIETPAHGKLLWDEDDHLRTSGPNGNAVGFGTSTSENHMFVFDLTAESLLTTFDFSTDVKEGTCRGTHAISYSDINRHIYMECTGGGGIIEINVNEPTAPAFVAQHEEATGSLYETPDEDYIVSSNKGNNALHIFTPQGNGERSLVSHNVDVPGHPSTPNFWTDDQGRITVCMPLTENTNTNHMDDAGKIVCDASNCSGATTEEDVANGICLYDQTNELALLTADLTQIESVRNGASPFNDACKRCELEGNYDEDNNGLCICTPACGSCAEDDYDASNSGSRCFKLNEILEGVTNQATLVKGGGSVRQGSPYAYSPECGFGRTYRTHKRGYIYDASVANYPEDSLVILDMSTQEVKCHVELPGVPSRVTYVPTKGSERSEFIKARNGDSDDGLSTGAIVGIVVGGIAFIGLMAFVVMRSAGANQKKESEGPTDFMEGSKDMETSHTASDAQQQIDA